MRSLLGLFESTKKDKNIFPKHKFIKDISDFPNFSCPSAGSDQHKKDMRIVKYYHDNKTLNDEFLKDSHDSMNKLFKNFCKENKININWKHIKKIKKEVDDIVGHLKEKFERPRPKEILKLEDSEHYSSIPDMKSYSFPSGHTAAAYFLCDLISHKFPNHRKGLRKLASSIAQSRIENGVHYPTDVLSGKIIGEICADKVINNNKTNLNLNELWHNKKSRKNLLNFYKESANKHYTAVPKNKKIKNFVYDLSYYIEKTLLSENINVSNENIFESVKNFLSGYPVEYCTQNKHMQNYFNLSILAESIKPLNTSLKLIYMHKNLYITDRGIIRESKKYSNFGHDYAEPFEIFNYISRLNNISNPWLKNLLYEWINPFDHGNKIISRVMLLSESNYDIKKCIDFYDNNYEEKLNRLINHYKHLDNVFE